MGTRLLQLLVLGNGASKANGDTTTTAEAFVPKAEASVGGGAVGTTVESSVGAGTAVPTVESSVGAGAVGTKVESSVESRILW